MTGMRVDTPTRNMTMNWEIKTEMMMMKMGDTKLECIGIGECGSM